MKKYTILSLMLVELLLIFPMILLAQDDDKACQLILQEGLYRQYKITRSGNFHKDLKTYFSSDEFVTDYNKKSWAGKIGVVLDGEPMELGAGATKTSLTEFQNRVRNATSLSVNQSFYDYSSTLIPDVELAKVYSECVIGNRRYGFKVTPRVGDKDVFFVINYFRHPSEASGMPKIKRFDLKGGSNVRKSFAIGDHIDAETSISADRDSEKDLVMLLETDRGVATYIVPAEPSAFNRDFPIGTIISSYLNWTEFQAATRNNSGNPSGGGIWTSKYSKWSPADGRQVPNSAFETITAEARVPDLRGQFLRGLNWFDKDQTSQVNPARKDPEDRTRGSYQEDDFKKHNHSIPGPAAVGHIVSSANNFFNEPVGRQSPIQTNDRGGDETRPRNIAVFYYIRIN